MKYSLKEKYGKLWTHIIGGSELIWKVRDGISEGAIFELWSGGYVGCDDEVEGRTGWRTFQIEGRAGTKTLKREEENMKHSGNWTKEC